MSLTPRGQRFPKWVRLHSRPEYEAVLKGGRKCVRRFLVAYARERGSEDLPTRLGLIVSRRVGNAVVRNQAKRRLREVFRCAHDQLRPGWDVVLGARVAARDATIQQLAGEFARCMETLGVAPRGALPTPSSSSAREGSAES